MSAPLCSCDVYNYNGSKRTCSQAAELTAKLEAARRAIELQSQRISQLEATVIQCGVEACEQAAQIKALEKDAARYRWLKENKAHNNTHCWHFQKGPLILGLLTLDAAIDAAMLGDSHD